MTKTWMLALLGLCSGWSAAQGSAAQGPAAQSSAGQRPTPGQARELMGSVCPGGAASGECRTCPDFVGGRDFGGTMTLEAVTYGKFLNAADTYALLDLSGCEPHANNYGGSVLLRWRGLTRWTFVKYLPGLRSGDCLKYPVRTAGGAPGRELLLCRGDYEGMGIVDTSLFRVDLARTLHLTGDRPENDLLFILEDSTAACLPAASAQSLVSWQKVKSGGPLPGLRVQVRSGSGKTGQTPEQCSDRVPRLPTHAYTLDYTYDGAGFKPTPGTRAILRRLLRDNPYLLGAP